jgi:hypothetical protein
MGNERASDPGKYIVSDKMKTVCAVLMFIGLFGFVVAMMKDQQRAWMAYLVPMFYFVSLALGGLFFTSIQHVTKAGWSVNIRRLSESLTSYLPIAAFSALIFLIGAGKVYEWLHTEVMLADPILAGKMAYLNFPFFIVRLVLFFAIWLGFRKVLVGRSILQDQTGDVNLTHSLVGAGVVFLLLFALSYSLFSVDIFMSLEPHFFSTIFGVYCFAGLFQSTMAFLILMIIYMRSRGLLRGFVTDDHVHDLGKFMFAFTVFWAYIAFSQYMLIWYANLPEETFFIIKRTEGAWLPVSLLLLIGKFIVPFLTLLPRGSKRNPVVLGTVAVWLLVMQYADLYWLAYPAIFPTSLKFGWQEITIFMGFLGAFLFCVNRFLSTNNIVPIKDPRIDESLHHHVVY